MRAFPQAKGVVIDGAGEHHYELAFHHGGELLELRESEKPLLQYLGKDLGPHRARIVLPERSDASTDARQGSLLCRGRPDGGLELIGFERGRPVLAPRPAGSDTEDGVKAYREKIDAMPRKRSSVGHDHAALVLAPDHSGLSQESVPSFRHYFSHKHYFWNRGFDGMYGTVARWVRTIGRRMEFLGSANRIVLRLSSVGCTVAGKTLADLDDQGFLTNFPPK